MIGYVAKDRDGDVYIHSEHPLYDSNYGGWFSSPDCLCITNKFPEFENLKYTDTPVKVEINIKRV